MGTGGGNHWGKNWLNRRDFLKVCGLSSGIMTFGSLSADIPLGFAKNAYPAEKIICIVPLKAGGGFDLIFRGFSPYLTKYLRQVTPNAKNGGSIVIKNEPAASGIKGYGMIYNAKPDGYTIGSFESAFATETLLSELEFDLSKFTYLVRVNTATRILVTRKASFGNWDEMIKSAMSKELKWGVGQFGRAQHVDSIIIKETLGIPARLIPFGGTAESMNALLRGDIQVSAVSEEAAKPLLDAGEIKILADFTGKGAYPGIPTSKDLGCPELAERLGGHRFVIGPPALPRDVSTILITAFKKVLTDPEFLTWAKKSEIPLNPIYGDDADRLSKRIFKYYQQDLKPLLNKYLK